MNNGCKISLKYLSALILTILFFCVTINSSALYSEKTSHRISDFQDTIPKKNLKTPRDTVIQDSAMLDTLPFHSDSAQQQIDTMHIPFSKDTLDAPISYSAQDSVVLDVPTKNITLYNKAVTKYKEIDLQAYNIRMDQSNSLLLATYSRDTSGEMIGRPKMTQNDTKMESDSMVFNMKTQKGITVNSFTQSGEIYVMGSKIKKISKDDYYAFHGRFTTCNLDTPHFAFITNKMKLINKKMAITGPVHPEFEGVPIPIYIPFGYFPISNGRHSGFLPPTFDVSSQYGLGLTGLGYYKVLSDNFDVVFKANLYSYGGYNLYLMPEYKVRYRYSGRLNIVYQNTRILSNSGKSPYDEFKTYNFQWSHVVDSKAHPGQNFSANVNLMSAKFNNYNITNPTAPYNNQINSSIAYSKTFSDGKYNLTVNVNHNQDNITGLVHINAPSIGFTAITIYPLAPKELIGTPKWYEKLGIGLNSSITGFTSFYDSAFSFGHLLDTFQYGAQNNIPITLALPQLGFLQITPGVSYQNRILSTKYDYNWGKNGLQKVDTTSQKGIYVANSLQFSLGLSTAIYGTFQNFGKNSRVMGIRHTVRPTISFSYSPDLSENYYKNVQITSTGRYENRSLYAGNVYNAFAPGTFGGMSFGVDNNIEMKVRSKTDTTAGANEKVKLIDGFGFNGSFNYLADSFRLSPIYFYLRSTLFKQVNISATTTLNPYQHDSLGIPINRYAWEGGGFNLGRIVGGNISISTSFKSKPKDTKKAEEDKKNLEEMMPMTIDEQQAQLDYIRQNPGQFADFNVSWSVNVSFAFSFTNTFVVNKYETQIASSLILNGDFNLTEKWKAGYNIYYDIKNRTLNTLTTFLSRDMHCWQLTINVTPVGYYRSFNITISPKSNILRDLRINRTRTFY
jgi:lipopolysaccharide assembly outer membrane protein LptD (OstA)